MTRLWRFVLLLLLLASTPSRATTLLVVNTDGAGEGFNDPTAVAPVGGNTAITLGAQRLAAFEYAASIWAGQLDSTVTVEVEAAMNVLSCSGASATLGQAGPATQHRDFAGALVANTYYPQALANKLAGTDLDPGTPDITATFNSTIGTTCSFPYSWYYGLDANPGPTEIDFVTVVLHELGHGLGFLSLVDLSSGAKFMGRDDAYMRHLEDHGTGVLYPDMTNPERAAAATATGDLHWVGPEVVANSTFLVGGRDASGHVEMYAPSSLQSGSSVAHFSTSLTPSEVMEPSYTGARHDVSLARDLLADIGWGPTDCGNGMIDAGEDCDDGAALNGDCCSSTCLWEINGTPCIDSDLCTDGDTCDGGGTCVGGGPADCNDDNPCSADSCTSPTGCTYAPTPGACEDGDPCTLGDTCSGLACAPGTEAPCPLCEECDGAGGCLTEPQPVCRDAIASGKSSLLVRDNFPDSGDTVLFKWLQGSATTLADLGNPLTTEDWALCLYDESGPANLIFRMTAESDGHCGSVDCWKPIGIIGYKYKDALRTPDGTDALVLRSGTAGRAKIVMKGKGTNLLNLPTAPLPLPLRAQIQSSSGGCFEGTFSSTIKNADGQFKARDD